MASLDERPTRDSTHGQARDTNAEAHLARMGYKYVCWNHLVT